VSCHVLALVQILSGFSESPPVMPASRELKAFAALNPIDVHAHVFKRDPAFVEMLRQLHLHIVDIVVVDDTSRDSKV